LAVLILGKNYYRVCRTENRFRLTYIALTAALPVIIFSPKRLTIIRRIDWTTLIFFAAMFILMASVWNSGVFQNVITSRI
jgi:Na+/H+ antiporter NhaD/arsenite permease-like protein